MTTTYSLVQPIMLLVDKNNPAGHADAVAAAAIASVGAYINALASGINADNWEAWLSERFAKSVRRADAKTFAKLAADPVLANSGSASVGSARAMAYAPTTYDQMPKQIARLQVSGTNLPEQPATPPPTQHSGDPVIVLNGSLGMSTGKASAQAAHALFAWHLRWRDTDLEARSRQLLSTGLAIATAREFDQLREGAAGPLIVDAGLTEIAPGTATAFVVERP